MTAERGGCGTGMQTSLHYFLKLSLKTILFDFSVDEGYWKVESPLSTEQGQYTQ